MLIGLSARIGLAVLWACCLACAAWRHWRTAAVPLFSSPERWSWPQLLLVFALLQTTHFFLGHLAIEYRIFGGGDTALVFLDILSSICGHGLFYVLLQLTGRHWSNPLATTAGILAHHHNHQQQQLPADSHRPGHGGAMLGRAQQPLRPSPRRSGGLFGRWLQRGQVRPLRRRRTLRVTLTRSEWRSILGLTLFSSLSSMVFITNSEFSYLDMLPICSVHAILIVSAAWRSFQQLRQISYFSRRLSAAAAAAAAPGGDERAAAAAEEAAIAREKVSQYRAFGVFHVCTMVFCLFLLAVNCGALVMIIKYAREEGTIKLAFEQVIMLSAFAYWTVCTIVGIL